MITKYGMDKDIGLISYAEQEMDEYFKNYKAYSEKTAEHIDAKIKEYIEDCYARAVKLIKEHKNLIEEMSLVLLEKEYLTKDEFSEMMNLGTKNEE